MKFGSGKYQISAPMNYAADGRNFVPVYHGTFEVKAGDSDPTLRAEKTGTFWVQKQ